MLKLVYAPDPILKKECSPVPQVDDHHRELISKMYDVMYEANGVGLAAPQVGIDMRIFILDPGAKEEEKKPLAMINPVLLSIDENTTPYEEGCLSLPGHYAEIERPAECRVKYIDYNGKEKEIEANGLLSTCIQHEVDHLNGTLFIDYLSKLKKDMILKKLVKHKKEFNKIIL